MFQGRQLNQTINKIQERALRITDKDIESTFSELLQKDRVVTIHTKNLQILMTEMYKTKNDHLCRESSGKIRLAKICEIMNLLNLE